MSEGRMNAKEVMDLVLLQQEVRRQAHLLLRLQHQQKLELRLLRLLLRHCVNRMGCNLRK
jgi:hypothetical protein